MKKTLWTAVCGALVLTMGTWVCRAQRVVPVGNIPEVSDKSPTWWAISGYEIVHITQSEGRLTPIMRTELFDARTVEILSRTQVPPLTASDVKAVGNAVLVRGYLLMRVTPQDARAAGTSVTALAKQWAASVAHVLPRIAPTPSRFGI
ncbi:hypothetical protein [Chthonomonas calidirosea]|uniref:hypothetical protein n=1 Tax=Chthonomonas calidirosea TaxID=454171 RepID=UPI0006ECAD18|nr:hypothetical protein [Chthonomonas calidirosea]CEK20057.1 hypothetical protein CP488_02731 [Chthonomonas calidirosea]